MPRSSKTELRVASGRLTRAGVAECLPETSPRHEPGEQASVIAMSSMNQPSAFVESSELNRKRMRTLWLAYAESDPLKGRS